MAYFFKIEICLFLTLLGTCLFAYKQRLLLVHKRISKNKEQGSAVLVCVVSILMLAAYLKFGQEILNTYLLNSPILEVSSGLRLQLSSSSYYKINLSLLAVLAIVITISSGMVFVMLANGGLPFWVKRKTIKRIISIDAINQDCRKSLKEIENIMLDKNLLVLTSSTCQDLEDIKLILFALDKRIDEIWSYLQVGGSKNIFLAARLLNEPLDFSTSSLDALLYLDRHQNMPAILPAQCGEILDTLFQAVTTEIQMAQKELRRRSERLNELKNEVSKTAKEQKGFDRFSMTGVKFDSLTRKP